MIQVIVVEAGKTPYTKLIESGLESLQSAVGGYIEAIYPWDDPVCIICNENGKLDGLELNRALRDEDGDIYDVISGTFLIAGLGYDDFTSVPLDLIEKYSQLYERPEAFIKTPRGVLVYPALDHVMM